MKTRPLMDVTGWEAFLHGVFAIAITLLVLDIRVPPADVTPNASALLDFLGSELPRYAAYALGFMYLGLYWINTHRILRLLRGIDHWFLVIGLVYLMVVAALPFVTALLAEYLGRDQERDKVALVAFTGWQLILAILANVVFRYASHGGRLLRPDVPESSLRPFLRVALMGPVIWLVALASALLLTGTITLALMAVLLVMFVLEPPAAAGGAGDAQRTD